MPRGVKPRDAGTRHGMYDTCMYGTDMYDTCMYGTDMCGICPASAITQVGDRLGCDSDQCLVVAAQDRHGGKCRVTNPIL